MNYFKAFLLTMSLITLISCGAVDNVFNDGSKNTNILGQILPGRAAPGLNILTPSESQKVGKTIKVSGECTETDIVKIESSDMSPSSIETPCTDDKYEVNITLNLTSAATVKITSSVSNETSSDSKVVNVDVLIDQPITPTHIDITHTRPTAITLDWNSSSDNSLPLQGYILEYRESSSSTWVSLPSNPIPTTQFTVENLLPATSYDFRVKAFNGNESDYSQVSETTRPSNPFFEGGIKVFNIAGATQSSLVAIETGDFYLNGNLLASLQAGEVHTFTSAQFDKISSDKAFFVAGLKGSGNNTSRTGNMTWTTQDWSSKSFTFAASRSAKHILSIVAFEDASITVKSGTNTIASETIQSDQGTTIELPNNANYQIESTGTISAFIYSATNSGNEIRDPRPILPASTDILGFPSRDGFISASVVGTQLDITHSNDTTENHTFANLNSLFKVSPQIARDRYKSAAVRIKATSPIEGISVADYDGYCAAPFVPRAKMKNTYAVNVESEWVAFASTQEGTITMTKPDGSTQAVQLTKTGTSPDAPYQARVTDITAGTLFSSDVKMGAWYEPKTNLFGARQDETLLYGYNL